MPVPQYMNFRAAVLRTGKMPVPQYMNFLVGWLLASPEKIIQKLAKH
ncbi:hypothetical protein H6F85_05250 [Microcoleus sp. FACHB-45]|nr:hypothetical protein [Microcoleus sp. FACHB-45]